MLVMLLQFNFISANKQQEKNVKNNAKSNVVRYKILHSFLTENIELLLHYYTSCIIILQLL